jgi:hypothetical protein
MFMFGKAQMPESGNFGRGGASQESTFSHLLGSKTAWIDRNIQPD